MNPEMKLQIKGLTAVGIILFAAGIILAFFFRDMSQNSLMGASEIYKPIIPIAAPLDITRAPQCAAGYDKPWIGCQKLVQ